MKRSYVFSLLVILTLVITPLAALAQDDEEWQTFTSADGKLTLSYPPDWIAEESEDFPFPHVFVTNSESAQEKMNAEEDIPPASGEVGLVVMVLPFEFLGMLGAELPEEPTLEDLTGVLATMFTAPEDGEEGTTEGEVEAEQATPEATAEGEAEAEQEATPEATAEGTEGDTEPMGTPTVGEFEEIDLGEGNMAGFVTIADPESEGGLIVRELDEGLILVVSGITFPGEFTEELHETLNQIANSVQYTGTAEEIMSTMMAPPDVETTTLDGETLINERCTQCHTRDQIDATDTDEEGWTAIVDRMIGYGAVLSEEEREALIQYLVETH